VRAEGGMWASNWAKSVWQCHACGKVDAATKFSCWFLSHNKSTYVDKRLHSFTCDPQLPGEVKGSVFLRKGHAALTRIVAPGS
jgi:hypothetical protein